MPKGMHVNGDGYLRIHRVPLRDQYAHRAYVNRQFRETYGRDLRQGEEVHHACGNRKCWPPTDFHLVVMDEALHHAGEAGKAPWMKRRRRKKK